MLFKTEFFGLTLKTGILPWLSNILSIKFCFSYHVQKEMIKFCFLNGVLEANNNTKLLFSEPYAYPMSKTLGKSK